jgi:hypothetical protein
MNPLLFGALSEVLKTVIAKITNQIPVSQTERENIELEAQQALADNAGVIAQAEAQMADARKDEWLADLATPYSLSALWRPITAIGCMVVILWDAVIVNVLNLFLMNLWSYGIAPSPATTVEIVSYVLLTLVGARSLDKFFATRKIR